MNKLMLLAGLAAGYVLGTKAGRERYEQLRLRLQRIGQDPHVQQGAAKVGHRDQDSV